MTEQRSDAGPARGMWTLLEPVHAVTYFSAPGRAGFEAAGLRGFWRGYFAGRCAPLGAVGADPVTALFCSFSPAMVTRALPAVWGLIDPAAALAARAAGAGAALRALAPDVPVGRVASLADRLWAVTAALDPTGRALGAANAGLPRPDDPHQALWQAATTLREHRGDGHVAAAVTTGLTGLELIALRCAAELDRAVLQPARGWTDQEWDAATARLLRRGLIGDSGRPTAAGHALVAELEAVTDRLAALAWADLIEAGELLPLARDLAAVTGPCRAALPDSNPVGSLTVWDPVADPAGSGWSGAETQVG